MTTPATPSLRVATALPNLWRGSELGCQQVATRSTGWSALDRELPGGGWPCRTLTEVLAPQPAIMEWRLLSPALRQVAADGGQIVAVAPPRQPYLPGLRLEGLDERRFVWIQAEAPAQRLWVTEQLLKSNACGAVLAWLPQARPEQLRRLQCCAQSCDGLVFLCRPEPARHASSAAPLRLLATPRPDWELEVRILKRRGPTLDLPLMLPSRPAGLAPLLTPRLQYPSRLLRPDLPQEVPSHAVGRPAPALLPRQASAIQ
ncbi:MAG: translesion DNA synthesis-associated protein ImuA [Proteobacteria bacterium]|nr:translesion DNA synthesis-associated protein ImuA [Pseudomonadota bacterium]